MSERRADEISSASGTSVYKGMEMGHSKIILHYNSESVCPPDQPPGKLLTDFFEPRLSKSTVGNCGWNSGNPFHLLMRNPILSLR